MKQTVFFILTFFTLNLNAQIVDVLTTNLSKPSGLAISGNNLYIAEEVGTISKIDITLSSPIKTVIVSGLSAPDGLAISGNTLYIAEYNADKISKINISLSSPIVETVITGVLEPTGIIVEGDYLYIAEYNANKISKLNLITLIKTDFITNISGPTGLSVKNNFLYFSSFDTNTVSKVDLTATLPTAIQVAAGLVEPAFMSLIGSDLYVAEYGAGKLSKINTVNSNVTTVATNLGGAYGLANNSNTIYLSQRDTNKISKIDLSTLSTANFEEKKPVSIFPNPTSNYLKLENVEKNSLIKIVDLNGRLVRKYIYDNSTIEVKNLEKGVYFLKINNDRTIKFIKK